MLGTEGFTICSLNVKASCQGQQWNSLDTLDILFALISELHGNARYKWNMKVMMIQRCHGREPELSDFIDFTDDETLFLSRGTERMQ